MVRLATEAQIAEIANVVQDTIKEIYPKYYRDEVVDFFIQSITGMKW